LASTFSYNVANTTAPDDPAYNSVGSSTLDNAQRNVHQALQSTSAWHFNTDCRDLIIGIVDSGVDTTHPDLAGNLLNLSTSGPASYGRNFVGGGGDVSDGNGHGTHVAGIIGAVGNNNRGVTGVCWTAKIIVAKVTDNNGSAYLSDVVDGLAWTLDQGARVVNISMGTYVASTTYSENAQFEDAFASATSKAVSKDALVIAAAGNNGADSDTNRVYPANLTSSQILAVGANVEGYSTYESLAYISNYGGHTVHLSAPGYNIMSTVRQGKGYRVSGSGNCGDVGTTCADYDFKTGTSMATPFVTGSLALMWDHIGVGNIGSAALSDLFLNYLQPHTTGSLGQPGKFLLTGAKLDLGQALQAADQY
jgi:subtilisin family serine protease